MEALVWLWMFCGRVALWTFLTYVGFFKCTLLQDLLKSPCGWAVLGQYLGASLLMLRYHVRSESGFTCTSELSHWYGNSIKREVVDVGQRFKSCFCSVWGFVHPEPQMKDWDAPCAGRAQGGVGKWQDSGINGRQEVGSFSFVYFHWILDVISLIFTLLNKLSICTNKSQNCNLSIVRCFLALVGVLLEYLIHREYVDRKKRISIALSNRGLFSSGFCSIAIH